MAGVTLEIAKKHLDAWLTAELEVTTHQSYTIGSRSLTKANLSEIRKQIQFWETVARLENISKRVEETGYSARSRGTYKKGGEAD